MKPVFLHETRFPLEATFSFVGIADVIRNADKGIEKVASQEEIRLVKNRLEFRINTEVSQ
jgi:hypothetical protein